MISLGDIIISILLRNNHSLIKMLDNVGKKKLTFIRKLK